MPTRLPALCLVLLCLLGLTSQAHAQAVAVTRLDLTRARQLASQRNVDVILGRLDVQLARLGFDVANRPFVPILGARVQWQDDTIFEVGGARSRVLSGEIGVDWQTAWGTRFDATASTAEYFFGVVGRQAPAQLAVGMSQPLLRGAWGEGNLLDVREIQMLVQRALFLEQLNGFLVEVDQAYWNLALAQADLEIKEKSVQRATTQFEDTTENVRRGILAPGEVYLVEENLVFFQSQKIRAIQTLKLAQADLARVLFLPPDTPIEATEPLVWDEGVEVGEVSLKEGLRNNPALAAQRLLIRQAGAQTVFDQNQIAPRLDLEARANLVGNAQDVGQAWQDVATAQNPDWRVAVVFEIPLVRKADYARVESAQVAAQSAEARRDQIAMELQSRLYQIQVQLQQGQALLALARRSVSLSLQKLDVEMQKYQSGLSTLFNVVRFQRDLDDSRIGEQRATVSLLILEARLGALKGVLWAESGLRVN